MSKKSIYAQLKPAIDRFSQNLLEELTARRVIAQISDQPGRYRLTGKDDATAVMPNPVKRSVFEQLVEFRNVALNVCFTLYPGMTSGSPLSFSKALEKLQANHAISIEWHQQKEMLETLDNLDALANDTDIQLSIEKKVTEMGLDINKMIFQLLEYFGKEKALNFFNRLSFQEKMNLGKEADLGLDKSPSIFRPLIFEFKLRRSNPNPDRNLLIKALKQIKENETVSTPKPFYFLIIFTHGHFQSFEKAKFRFREAVDAIREFLPYREQIKYIPVSTGGLQMIDQGFEEFAVKYIKKQTDFVFQAQEPPPGFPDRNDHFLEEIFEIRRTDLTLVINPGKTKFWRMGLRFSKDGKFPDIGASRHTDTRFADVHIKVGSMITDSDKKNMAWNYPNELTLTNYNAQEIEDKISIFYEYRGDPVTFRVSSNEDASSVRFQIQINGQPLGERTFDLHEFKFCRIFAWADHVPFRLETKIIADYK